MLSMKFYKLFLFIAFFFAINTVKGNDPICDLKSYSYEEGLPHSTITGILQDKHGLMWFGTWNGLSSFDGYVFRNFRPYPGDGCTMMNSRINKIALGAEGDIWCINQEDKAYLFDVKSHKFVDALQPVQIGKHAGFYW